MGQAGQGAPVLHKFHAAAAWVAGRVERDVEIDCVAGLIRDIRVDCPPDPRANYLPGLVTPGFADAHSHIFHRGLRGRTHDGTGTFWTWRDRMYELAGKLDPDGLRELAFAGYLEMLCAGYTAVGEFHYLHHPPGGGRYGEPNAMGLALATAADESGIGLTLLDIAYLAGGFGAPVSPVQQRFSDGSAVAWADRVAALPADVRVGVGIHSVRAVPVSEMPTVVAAAGADRVLHVHLSEQPAENADALSATGRTPTQLLADAGAIGPRTAVVHGTHLTERDIQTLGAAETFVVICPTTEADLADGLPAAGRLAAAGARLSLGGDQQVLVDPFAQARGLEYGERLAGGRRGVFPPAALWSVALELSHAAIGSPGGVLAVGAPADLVAIRTDSARTAGADLEMNMPPLEPAAATPSSRSTLLYGISELVTNDPAAGPGLLGIIPDAAVVLQGEQIAWVGPATSAPSADTAVDLGGRAVLPGWVDSHSHVVFAGDRAAEFAARMAGQPYRAGGMQATVSATREATDADLLTVARRHRAEMIAGGTTCMETKTGYGLTVRDEVRSATTAETAGFDEISFLGAHVVPAEYAGDADGYLDLVCGPMIDAVAPRVRWIDAFCETGAFDEAQTRRVLAAGRRKGLGLRVHGNQLSAGPGVRIAVDVGAASVDHCTHLADRDIAALASSATVATLLPACDLSTRQPPAPARALVDAGARIALASNCNPGSSYTSSMNLVVALGVLLCKLSTQEAVYAATAGGAAALLRTDVGVVSVGARADLHVLDAPSHEYLAYRVGVPLTHAVYRKGALVSPVEQAAVTPTREPVDQRWAETRSIR